MKKLLILATAVVALAACGKDDDQPTVTKTAADHLKAGKWFISAETEREVGPGVDTTYDYYADYKACERDDYMLFTQDSVTYDNGATKCDPTDAQVIATANWNLIENNSKLVVKYIGGSDTMGITTLNETTLEFKDVYTSNGTTYTYIQRWKH